MERVCIRGHHWLIFDFTEAAPVIFSGICDKEKELDDGSEKTSLAYNGIDASSRILWVFRWD